MKTVITAKIKDDDSSWIESFTFNIGLTDEEAKKYVQETIENFNRKKRPHETTRSLVKILIINRYFT